MAISQVKFNKALDKSQQTYSQVQSALTQLNSALSDAIKVYAYILKNPDNNNATDISVYFESQIAEQITVFRGLTDKVDDLDNTKLGTMTVDELIAKRAVDLTQFSNGLI